MPSPSFPDDLLQIQRDWYSTYRRLADVDGGARTAALRRRLLQLSAQIARHPFWDQAPEPAARMALKQAAWSSAVR